MYLGLDFGTSGARACALAADRSTAWELRVPYANPANQMPEDWRSALLQLLGAIPPGIAGQLRGIAIDATSATVLLCDAQLTPVSPALLYNDSRAQAEAGYLRQLAGNNALVGSATSGLAKFLRLTAQPGNDQAHYFMHQADWLTALLSGQPGITDYHNALKTGYDVAQLRWPDWILALPHAHLLPEVRVPGSVIGGIRPALAARFGIAPACAIHAGTTDSTAAFVASGITETGAGLTSLGTTLVLKQLSDTRIEAPEYGIYSHRLGDRWLVGGASNSGAGVLRQFFDDPQLAELSRHINPATDSPLNYYPLPAPGERFPYADPQLAPRLEPRPVDDAAFLHGLLQGLSRIEAAGYERLAELGAPALKRVVSTGGGAKNPVWQQLRQRRLGVPVSIADHSEAAYGTALLAAREGI
ncbi:MAG: FGGY-family carbohydrate kinase [Gallionella sp.]|jgi:sugar (pentulose or hexulose) kinase|nr:FGGY-family carbohydrate kinase [Gallionella sp.]